MHTTPQTLAAYEAIFAAPGLPLSLGLRCSEERLLAIEFLSPAVKPTRAPALALASEAVAQLEAYMAGRLARFDLPLQWQGTSFQRRVWRLLRDIPPACTRTYGELAMALDSSARAVGGACRANPLPVVVPCHRVVARTGLGGFAGQRNGRRLAFKQCLLSHEKRFFDDT